MQVAPIILFVYNRPWHVRQTLEALSKNELAEKSELFIYADGFKAGGTQEQLNKVLKVRKIIRENNGVKRLPSLNLQKTRVLQIQ